MFAKWEHLKVEVNMSEKMVTIDQFGVSVPGDKLIKEFGFTLVKKVLQNSFPV
ncbi:hypothetical protein [Fictibacillus phosphorivorans]|uniref:hypothetical protein n=1 Tax=Fictibacillus phosphorivorans TaxID=1221500 RepID=UPI00203DE012|nr:hypothetical protein [Fictibacillus phosphorivorans]MCM3775656.1 hypothetical protein [Fictibacillus phosphorivorans]